MAASASVLAPAAFLHRDVSRVPLFFICGFFKKNLYQEHSKQYQAFMEQMAISKLVPRPALLDQAHPVMIKSLHGWDRQVYCDNLNTGIPGSHSTSSCTRAVAGTVLPRVLLIALKMSDEIYSFSFPPFCLLKRRVSLQVRSSVLGLERLSSSSARSADAGEHCPVVAVSHGIHADAVSRSHVVHLDNQADNLSC